MTTREAALMAFCEKYAVDDLGGCTGCGGIGLHFDDCDLLKDVQSLLA